jgi:hypothetical protein
MQDTVYHELHEDTSEEVKRLNTEELYAS